MQSQSLDEQDLWGLPSWEISCQWSQLCSSEQPAFVLPLSQRLQVRCIGFCAQWRWLQCSRMQATLHPSSNVTPSAFSVPFLKLILLLEVPNAAHHCLQRRYGLRRASCSRALKQPWEARWHNCGLKHNRYYICRAVKIPHLPFQVGLCHVHVMFNFNAWKLQKKGRVCPLVNRCLL